jgi:hypothetical protein
VIRDLPITVESLKFSSAEPVAYEWSSIISGKWSGNFNRQILDIHEIPIISASNTRISKERM